jgi:hypothetical protein
LEAREAIERAHEAEKAGGHGRLPEKVGVIAVAVLAALLAVASVAGRRSVTNLLLYQEQATNAASVAESNRIQERIDANTLLTLRVLATDPDTAGAAQEATAALEQEIATTFRPEEARLAERAEMLDDKRDDAERRYESYEIAETMLQIAIVFTTIAVAVRSIRLIWVSGTLGAFGLIFLIDGFVTVLPL